MRVAPLSNAGGIIIRGVAVNACQPIAEEIARLFDEHGLILFPGQTLDQDGVIAAASLFGGAGAQPALSAAGTAPSPFSVITTRQPSGEFVASEPSEPVGQIGWHTDQAYLTTPNRGKLLFAREVPREGGMTGFIDGQLTYDALPDDTKARIDGLHVVQSWRFAQETIARNRDYHTGGAEALAFDRFPDVAYPMVRRHPVTGRKSLNAPPLWTSRIAELGGTESADLIAEIQAHMTDPRFAYWHRYAKDDLIVWDNWRFAHAASGSSGRDPRTLWSVAIQGEVEVGRAIAAA